MIAMDERYCRECGSPLTPEATFCPACGAIANPVDGPVQTINGPAEVDTTHQVPQRTNNRLPVTILCLIWGVSATALGLMMYFNAESMTNDAIEQLKNMVYSDTQSYWDLLVESGFGREFFIDMYHIFGISFVLSGIMALVSAYFVYLGAHYKIALLTLILSSILAALQIIPLIVGLVVTYMLTKNKSEFVS